MGFKASTVPTLDVSAPLETGKFLARAGLDAIMNTAADDVKELRTSDRRT
jgi:hypothetical protein